FLYVSTASFQGKKGGHMKLKIRYENEMQTIELDSEATQELWISLSLEGDDLSEEEKEEKIQKEWDEKFNKPDYNNWHKETRHIDGTPKRKRFDGKRGYIQGDPDDTGFDILEYLCITEGIEIEEDCSEITDPYTWVRQVLSKKPEWVDAFIAVRINGESIRSYAARIGADENNITQKLKRAEKKLKENFKKRQI
ncbi:hypothetical protein, partial [Butyrivibrio sp. WCD2001]|uniref:hypothetical protein n=1 Tax=Butyrivibrio sp. WCD2001 TaxID=1280681 RepID=UPI001FA79FA4